MPEKDSRVEQLKSLDRLCDEFESRWSSGQRPSLAALVAELPDSIRSEALYELLSIELESRRELGEQPRAEEYLPSFSDQSDVIWNIFDETATNHDTTCLDDTFNDPAKAADGDIPEIEDFEILGELGRGGMGVVYKAHQISLDRTVAVKVIRSGEFATQEQIDRFLGEARATAKLQHPGIVNVFEVGQAADQYYFAMEFIEGRTLDDVLKSDDLPEAQVLRYVCEVAEAIQFAHEKGVIHRDIKPSNILIDQFGHARVMDFGLARTVQNAGELTGSGQILGTPAYMSPEQARGERTAIDERTDVYALGSVLYRVLTGRVVFESDSVADSIAMIMRDNPVSIREQRPNIDPRLERFCLSCLQKSPDDRPASAAAVADALKAFALRQGQHDDTQPPSTRQLWLMGGGIIAAAILLAAVIIRIKLGDHEVTVTFPH